MAYTPDKPKLAESSEQLRARIPGWGADLDPADRPSVPREKFDPTFSGAHWEFPERQPELWPRERSIEHAFLTPVFGTSCPPRGLSGKIRRYSYAKYSEGRAAHWLLLLASDRVDAVESTLRSLLSTRPDNPITETGISADGPRGDRRADKNHQWIDPIIVAAPWVAGAGLTYALIRRLARGRRA